MATGNITRVNRPSTEGAIERDDDDSFDLYQFRIPQDLRSDQPAFGKEKENKPVSFNVNVGRTANDVFVNG